MYINKAINPLDKAHQLLQFLANKLR